jgi:HAD superfamily hydrolase (TIGR01509 family)
MTIKALIFDFDGLILDTEGPEWECWQALFTEHGVELDLALWQAGVGTIGGFDPLAHLETLLGRTLDRAQIEAEQSEKVRARCHQQPLLPGVVDLLDAADAAGLRLGLASSSSRRWVLPWLELHGLLPRFACVRTRDDVEHPKPAPDLYLSAAACLGLEPAECLALEDSPHGLRAALAAGLRCVVVPTAVTASLEFAGAALRLSALSELPLSQVLARLDQRADD